MRNVERNNILTCSVTEDKKLVEAGKKQIDSALDVLHWSKKLANNEKMLAQNCCDKKIKYYGFCQSKKKDQIRGYVTVNKTEQTIYVSFLGTSNFRDVFYDFKFKKICSPFKHVRGKIHYGFYQLYQECRPELNTLLNRLITKYPKYHLVLTGHSMGATMAIFHSINLLSSNNHHSLILFCLPKIGNKTFNVSYLNLLRLRLVPFHKTRNDCDLITRLPPSLFGYESLYKYRTSSNECPFRRIRLRPHPIRNLIEDLPRTQQ